MPGLPTPMVTIACGACGSELEHDGDTFACYDCQLAYSNDLDSPAEYLDTDEQPCGKPHHQGTYVVTKPFRTTSNHAVVQWRTTTTTFGSCVLPASHTGLCEWPSSAEFVYHDTDPKTKEA